MSFLYLVTILSTLVLGSRGIQQTEKKRVGFVITDANLARCERDFAGRNCSISLETGDLTLGSVRMEDEGPYVCKKSFRSDSSDSRDRLRQLNVNGKVFVITCVPTYN